MSRFEDWDAALSVHDFSREFLHGVAQAGIKTVEISPSRRELGTTDWVGLKRTLEAEGIDARSFHLPFGRSAFNPGHPDEEYRRTAVQDLAYFLGKAAYLGARIAVIHPTVALYDLPKEQQPVSIANAKKSLRELADRAEEYGITVAAENQPLRTAEHMRDLLDSDPRLGFCFDVNHLTDDTHENMLMACGGRLVTLHISDFDFVKERHCMPGAGRIDFGKLIPMIEATGYDGAFTYEVALGGSADKEFPFPPCTPADVYANKQTLRTVTGEGKRI